ncbi:helix-turn-helix domain-containing protein, partial [Dubosiella newyorkensis]
MDIGRRICQHRKALGYTQQKLAEMSNQEPSNISHIERGATKLGLPT